MNHKIQRPDAEAPVGHGDAQHAGHQRAAQSGEEETLELQGLGHIGLLHVIQARHHHQQAQHPQDGHIAHVLIVAGDEGRGQEQPGVEQQAEAQIEEEDGGKIHIVRILLLNKRVGHAAVGKDPQDGDDRHDDGDISGGAGAQLPGQHDAHYDVHRLGAEALKKAPYEVGDNFGLFIHGAFDLL